MEIDRKKVWVRFLWMGLRRGDEIVGSRGVGGSC